MAIRPPSGSITGQLETGRLGGRVGEGTPAFHRKQFTLSARTSMSEINRRYSEFIDGLRFATPGILLAALRPVWQKSQMYVPVKFGDLKKSGKMSVTETKKNQFRAVVSYGNAGTPYAAIVHERIDIQHRAPTRAKYLQSAMEEEFGTLRARIAEAYRRELGR